MAIQWTQSIDAVDWDEMSELYRIAPLGTKSADWLKTGYFNSMFKCVALDEGKIVAAGRAVADGVDFSYLCDIVVHPDHQGSGLGKELIQLWARFASRPEATGRPFQRSPQDHPVCRARSRAVLCQVRFPPDDHRDGHLCRPATGRSGRLYRMKPAIHAGAAGTANFWRT